MSTKLATRSYKVLPMRNNVYGLDSIYVLTAARPNTLILFSFTSNRRGTHGVDPTTVRKVFTNQTPSACNFVKYIHPRIAPR
jgi:hypothetical protein